MENYVQENQVAKQYIRDGRSPIPASDKISKVMSANKAKNTKPELLLRKALYANSIRGYRINVRELEGSPDIVFTKKQKIIFVHGCYWHRCPICNLPLPKTNMEFWKTKFERNIERDKRNITTLNELGWNVLVIWECQINDSIQNCVNLIKKFLME